MFITLQKHVVNFHQAGALVRNSLEKEVQARAAAAGINVGEAIALKEGFSGHDVRTRMQKIGRVETGGTGITNLQEAGLRRAGGCEVEIQRVLLCRDRETGRGSEDRAEVGNGRSRVSNAG